MGKKVFAVLASVGLLVGGAATGASALGTFRFLPPPPDCSLAANAKLPACGTYVPSDSRG